MCTKYHGHTAMLETVFSGLVVGGERIAMAMVVVGHICTQSIMVIHNIIYYPLPETICVAMATCNFVGKMLLTSIMSMSNYTFIVCIVFDLEGYMSPLYNVLPEALWVLNEKKKKKKKKKKEKKKNMKNFAPIHL